jgi:hypothetical protein
MEPVSFQDVEGLAVRDQAKVLYEYWRDSAWLKDAAQHIYNKQDYWDFVDEINKIQRERSLVAGLKRS